jgi:hypothetical protein
MTCRCKRSEARVAPPPAPSPSADGEGVFCKISGLVTEADLTHWQGAELAPYVAHALAVFGPKRVIFGSDWPVMTLASSYQRWAETLHDLIQHLPLEERHALWAESARRWYRLAPSEMRESPPANDFTSPPLQALSDTAAMG